MKKVDIFDPAMCCTTGVCGPSVDPELTRIASAIYALEKKGFNIQRYQLTKEPDKFAENKEVNQILQDQGPDGLPIILVNDQVMKTGSYPTNEELAEWFDLKPEELLEKPEPKVIIDLKTIR